MTSLSITLFGTFQATMGETPINGFRTSKSQAFLIILCSEQEPQRREILMNLLWPGMPERSARHNLRQALYHLRQTVPAATSKAQEASDLENVATVPLILANRQTIQLNPQADVAVDINQFSQLLRQVQTHDHVDLLTCHHCRQNLLTAVDLYHGDFLADFYLDDSNDFEIWADSHRQQYRRQVLDALETLTTIHLRQKRYAEARTFAERQLDIDNLRESAYRQLMEIMAMNGQRQEALAIYDRCRQLLAEELGMAPTTQTSAIYEKIQAGDLRFDDDRAQGVRGYELKEEIGEGAYGTIYRGVQPTIGREVAVKVIRRQYANDPAFIRRFEAEAQTIARLEHPYIVPLYDYWREPDGAYLVMRLLRGGSLLQSLVEGQWSPEQAIPLVDQMASALAAAHRQGIVHRDIKPANILFDEAGNGYLSDFGIAKDTHAHSDLTGVRGMLGTPDYVSPEQLRNEAITPQSDIYSLGAVIYELLTGEKPFPNLPLSMVIQKQLIEPLPLVSATQPDLPLAIDNVIKRCTAKEPAERYPDALALAAAFRQAVQGTVSAGSILGPTATTGVDLYNPYKGLRAFQEGDAVDFYGRDSLTQQLLARLDDSRFLAVVGPSGSGKSSLIKAGLIPALREVGLPDSDKWFVAEMMPGTHPLEELELALLPIAVNPPPSLLEPMQKDERGLLRTLRRILPQERKEAQLLLVIDQFEELFTLVEDDGRRQHFIKSLVTALNAHRSPLRLVVTLRADFYDRPLQMAELAPLFKQQTEVILPLNREELTQAVQAPAQQVGINLEAELVTAIVADVGDQPSALPLLQHVLTELFEARQDNIMTLAAYQALGGVSAALAQRAEEIFNKLTPDEQETTRQLFLRLITLGEGVEDTRRRVRQSELGTLAGAAMTAVIEAYGRYRLLTFDHDPLTREPTVEVAHEALLREWPRLRRWLEESRDDVRLQRLLAAAASEWARAGEDNGFLLRGSRLDLFGDWVENTDLALTEQEHVYLSASLAARTDREAAEEARQARELATAQQLAQEQSQRAEEQTRAAGRLRWLAAGLTIVVFLAIAATFVAITNANRATDSKANALVEADQRATAQAEAEKSEQEANSQRATAVAASFVAEAERNAAVAAEATAVAAGLRADEERVAALAAEAEAEAERQIAEEQTRLTISRELALAALINLDIDPERSLLLALSALEAAYTSEAEEVLHQAIRASRIINRFQPHEGYAIRLAFSPDGKSLATVGTDGLATIWDVATGQKQTDFSGHSQDWAFAEDDFWVNYVEYSPDGTKVATVGDNGTLRIWAAETGIELLEIDSYYNLPLSLTEGYPVGFLGSVAFNADGTKIARGFADGARIWDTETGEELLALIAHNQNPAVDGRWGAGSVDFSLDNRLVTAGVDFDGQAIVWDSVTGEKLVTLAGHEGGMNDVRFNPDGSFIATIDGNQSKLWDSTTGELIHTWDHGGDEVRFSPDGRFVGAAGQDGSAKVWDVVTGQEIVSLNGHLGNVQSLDFTPDGRQLVTASQDGFVRFWDITPAHETLTFDVGHNFLTKVTYSPDGHQLATLGGVDGSAHIWDAQSGEKITSLIGHSDWVGDIVYNSNGTQLATASDDHTARLWAADSGETIQTFSGHDNWVNKLAFSPDDRLLATAGQDKKVIIWDTATGHPIHTLEPFADGVWSIAFSPDGTRLATGISHIDPTIYLWDVATGKKLMTLSGHEAWVNDLAFSPDGTRLLSASGDATVRIWDMETGDELMVLELPSDARSVTFSPDGQLVATGELGGRIKLWDPATGVQLITLLDDGGGSITNVEFNPEGNRLIANAGSSTNGLVREFVIPLVELIELAESKTTRSLTEDECQQYLHMDSCPDN